MNKTPNYQLNQWEADDRVQRVDFNADNAKIDAALAAKAEKSVVSALQSQVNTVQAAVPKFACGTYTGDGAASRTISLGFTPKAVLVVTQEGVINSSGAFLRGGLAVTGSPAQRPNRDNLIAVQICSGGFQVFFDYESDDFYKIHTNTKGDIYNYIAFG